MSEAVAAPYLSPLAPTKGVGLMRLWLLVIAVMVYGMILVGGATRLTDSGLSITEWKPLLGSIPPMNEADWQDAFAKYRTMTAQYSQLNFDMDLAGFKSIYWWEWSHRQLGRSIGMVFLIPFLAFLALKMVPKKLLPHLLVLFALGGLQGLIGWWMVASGVNSELTSVAPYRLMTHFCLALLIIGYSVWLWLELGRREATIATPRQRRWAGWLLGLVCLQMALGALVAGLDAGRGYTDWPLMGGKVVPDALFALKPFLRNFVENEATVQFGHRINAYGIFFCGLWTAWAYREAKLGFVVFAGLLIAQVVLGIVTLLHAAPLDLSLMHQALGVVVLVWGVRLVWKTHGKAQVAPA